MNVKRVLAGAIVLIGLLALPGSASALSFLPSPGGPITLPSVDDTLNSFAVADLDGNGNDDIVAVGNSEKIFVFLARNDGSGFDPAADSPFGSDSTLDYFDYVHAANFGGDSAVDVLVGNTTRLELFIGQGNGSFPETPSTSYTAQSGYEFASSSGNDPSSVADVNGDGNPDFISGSRDHTLTVLLGSGAPSGYFSLAPGTPYNIPTPNLHLNDGFVETTLGDFDGDDELDVAMIQRATPGSGVSPDGIYTAYGTGTGEFTVEQANPLVDPLAGENLQDVAAINLTGSGPDDLAYTVTSEVPQVNLLKTMVGSNLGGLVPNGSSEPSVDFWDETAPARLAVADIDGDSHDDIFTGLRQLKRIATVLSDGADGIDLSDDYPFYLPPIGELTYYMNSLVAGDFNGDGYPDIASGTGHNSPTVARGINVLLSKAEPELSTNEMDFEVTSPGSTSATQTLTITNHGAPPLQFDEIELEGSGADQFDIVSDTCDSDLEAGESCLVTVAFEPAVHGDFSANLAVVFGDGAGAATPSLTGSTPPDASPSPTTVEFGEVISGYEPGASTLPVTITSVGGAPVELADPVIDGFDAQYFSLVSPDACDGTLAPTETCTLQVRFAPGADIGGFLEAQINFDETNDPTPTEIQLEGYGRQAEYTIDPATHDFGQVALGTAGGPVAKTFTLTSAGQGDLPVNGASITGPDAASFSLASDNCPALLEPMDTCSFQVTFDPNSGSAGARNASLDVDLFSSTDEPPSVPLTGTAALPGSPKLSLKLKAAKKVKAGKKLAVTATVRNAGKANSGPIVLKAKAPGKVARKVPPIRIKVLPFGKSAVRKFRIPVKKSARGSFKVTVTMTHAGRAKAGKSGAVKVSR